MSKLPVLIILGLIILGGGVFIFLTTRNSQNLTLQSPSPSPTSSASPTQSPETINDLGMGGSSYSDSTGLFSLLYPNDFILDESDPKHPRIYKTGPTQKGQTEMYDGVIMVFEAIDLGNQDLGTWVDNYLKSSTADGTSEVTEAKKSFSLNQYPGYTFKIRGLGESQYYILQKDSSSNNALMITTLVADPENVGFQKQVDDTLTTLQILK